MTIKDVQIPPPKLQFFDANGDPLVGGKVFTYAAGTTTKIVTYTDATGLTPNTNPIILDARGECSIWVPPIDPSDIDPSPPGPAGPQGPRGPAGASGTGGLLSVVREFTTADIMTLNTPGNFLELVSPPGADKTLLPVVMLFEGLAGEVPFTTVGDFKITYFDASQDNANAAIAPSMDILTGAENRRDYAPIVPVTFGYGFRSDNGSVTYATVGEVGNKAIVLWSLAGGFDDSGGVDMGLRVTTWYLDGEATAEPPPNNDLYAVTDGFIETTRRKYLDTGAGLDLTSGFNALRDLPIAWTTSVVQQNSNNPTVIDLAFPSFVGAFFVRYPCLIEFVSNLTGNVIQFPFQVEFALSHTDGDDVYGNAQSALAAVGTVTNPAVIFANTTGVIRVESTDIWDGDINVDDTGVSGDMLHVSQLDISATVVKVLGEILTYAINAAGSGYAVGDYIENVSCYVRALWRVTTVGGGGAVTGLLLLDGGLGYSIANGYATNALTGGGTGLTIDVSVTVP